ncbi:MAG: lecithin retinol acyltransferase family protein [Ruminococcus sp.]|uniref:lecithin retinol acyltransferase family protein n=1 Tax=Ruminococcus sp. TaxID=41978 RepID=UPI0028733F46|nr:lecithin retinol acyltransferase family protein [Ruminococcus sp.]MBQ3284301.1 lecithin retinol acyltransferase family protein [Ruminococcus sp.]
MKWEYKECRFGDIIRVKLGSVYHYGIFVSDDEVIAFGLPPTAENLKNRQDIKVLATDIDVFSCGNLVETAVPSLKEKMKRRSPEQTVAMARARIDEGGYNIIHNNCEHFVNEIVYGEKVSEQERSVREKWRRFHTDNN